MRNFKLASLALAAIVSIASLEARDTTEAALDQALETAAADKAIPVIIQAKAKRLPAATVGAITQQSFRLSVMDFLKIRRQQADLSTRRLRELLGVAGSRVLSVGGPEPRKARYLWSVNAVVTSLSPDKIRELSTHPDVAMIYQDRVVDALLDESAPTPATSTPAEGPGVTWGVEKIGAPALWEKNLTGEGIILGHIDTGVDAAHPRLEGQVILFKDFIDGKETPYDDNGHGTHTAGTVAGTGGIGVAPGAKLVVAKALNSFGGGKLSGLLEAMQWFVELPADKRPVAVCNSWGIERADVKDAEKLFWDATQAWRDAGILPVFASGNSGADTEAIPGGYPMAFAVGATDDQDGSADFSTGGNAEWDGVTYVKPDVAAPGVAVLSAWPGGKFRKSQGTSMACPHVAGMVALVKQANPGLGPDEIQALIESTSLDLGDEGRDARFGLGRVDASRAVGGAGSSVASR